MVRYDILALLRGKDSQAFSGFDLEDVTIDARFPEDQAVIDRLVELLRGVGEGGKEDTGPLSIAITGKNISARVSVEGQGTASLVARTISFSTAKDEKKITFDGRFSVDVTPLALVR